MLAFVGRRDLRSDAGLAPGHHRKREADHVDSFLEEPVGHGRGDLRVAEHDRNDGMAARHELEPEPGHSLAEIRRVLAQLLAEIGGSLQHLEDLDGRGRNRGRQRVREQVGPRPLAEPADDLAPCGDVPAAGAAERLAERPGEDVDPAHDSARLVRPAPFLAGESHRVRIVDHDERVVLLGEVADGLQVGEDPVHREDAVSRDEADARVLRLHQPGLQVGHVVVRIAQALRLGEPDAVDDARVVQGVADHRVALLEKRLEEPAVGVEARRVEDGVLGAEEARDADLQLLVDVLGPADETHGGHAVSMPVEPLPCRLDDPRMIGEAEVVVRAEVQHLAPALYADDRALRALDDALALEQPLLVQGFSLLVEMSEIGAGIHGGLP